MILKENKQEENISQNNDNSVDLKKFKIKIFACIIILVVICIISIIKVITK